MGRKAGEIFRCSCGEQCVMVAHRATGKLAPITTATYDDSNIEVFGDGGLIPLYRIVPKQEREADPKPLHLNHFTNCPRREAFGGRAR